MENDPGQRRRAPALEGLGVIDLTRAPTEEQALVEYLLEAAAAARQVAALREIDDRLGLVVRPGADGLVSRRIDDDLVLAVAIELDHGLVLVTTGQADRWGRSASDLVQLAAATTLAADVNRYPLPNLLGGHPVPPGTTLGEPRSSMTVVVGGPFTSGRVIDGPAGSHGASQEGRSPAVARPELRLSMPVSDRVLLTDVVPQTSSAAGTAASLAAGGRALASELRAVATGWRHSIISCDRDGHLAMFKRGTHRDDGDPNTPDGRQQPDRSLPERDL